MYGNQDTYSVRSLERANGTPTWPSTDTPWPLIDTLETNWLGAARAEVAIKMIESLIPIFAIGVVLKECVL